MLDHPLPSYADGEVITHGIYDTQHNTAHMNLSLGHDTGAFSCASFLWFWEHHYPVYCSKYNPIERRVFPWVERAYAGQIFKSAEEMKTAIEEQAHTSTGLTTTAHVLEETFRPATKAEQQQASDIAVEYPDPLKDYNYQATPNILQ